MSSIIIILSVGALLTGCLAAFYWWKASKVMVMPMYEQNGELAPLPITTNQGEWLYAVFLGIEKSGALNKTAATWTAISVALGGVSSIISALN